MGMRLEIDMPEHHYHNIMAFDSVNLGRVPYKGIIMYAINAIKHGRVLDQEPTTKNDLVTLTFSKGTLKYSCKDYVVYKKDWLRSHYGAEIDIMFGDSQYKEPTTPNDCETCIHNKGVLECDMYGCKYEPTTKNDLPHCQYTDEEIAKSFIEDVEAVKDLLPTTENDLVVVSELEKNSKKLEKDFGELDCISRADVRSLVVKIDRKYMFCMSGKAFQDLYKGIDELPSVTPQSKTGHWIADVDRWGDVVTTVNGYRCDKCNAFNSDKDNYCPNCGARMEVEDNG